MPRTTTEPVETKTDAQKKNALYGQAVQEIRNRHFEEFQEIISDLYEAAGFTYRKRLSDAEKAEQQVRALIAANPGLAEKVADLLPSVDATGFVEEDFVEVGRPE